MLNVLIVDDNSVEREYLRALLEEIEIINVIGEADGGLLALDTAASLDPDVIFLDIQMPGIDGVSVAKQVMAAGSKAFIVFVTVESTYAAEAFELNTVDYLLKPFDRVRLRKTVIRIRQRIAANAALSNEKKLKHASNKIAKLFLRSEGDTIVINVPDIIFIEKDPQKRTLVHTTKGVYQVPKSITDIQEDLASFPNFVRSHRSYLINMDQVEKITPWGDSSYLVLFNNYKKDALISRSNVSIVKERFSEGIINSAF